VLREADALAELPEAILVDRLDAEEHDLEADAGPEPEDLLVPEQHVAARLDVVPLLDATAGDGLPDRPAVLRLDEGRLGEDEEARLADARHFLDGALGCLHAVAATVERPGAAEGAVPGAAAAELDRGTGIELADEVLAPMAEEVARRQQVVEMSDEPRRRS